MECSHQFCSPKIIIHENIYSCTFSCGQTSFGSGICAVKNFRRYIFLVTHMCAGVWVCGCVWSMRNCAFPLSHVKYLRRKIITSPFLGQFIGFSCGRPFIGISISVFTWRKDDAKHLAHEFDNNRIHSGRKAADVGSALSSLNSTNEIQKCSNLELGKCFLVLGKVDSYSQSGWRKIRCSHSLDCSLLSLCDNFPNKRILSHLLSGSCIWSRFETTCDIRTIPFQ